MAGINKDPLNKGILTGKFTAESIFPEDDIRSQVNFKEDRIANCFALRLVSSLISPAPLLYPLPPIFTFLTSPEACERLRRVI